MEAVGGLVMLALLVAAVVLAILAVLMPVFVYQISQRTAETVAELRALNGYLRQLAPQPTQTAAVPAPVTSAQPPPAPPRRSVERPYRVDGE